MTVEFLLSTNICKTKATCMYSGLRTHCSVLKSEANFHQITCVDLSSVHANHESRSPSKCHHMQWQNSRYTVTLFETQREQQKHNCNSAMPPMSGLFFAFSAFSGHITEVVSIHHHCGSLTCLNIALRRVLQGNYHWARRSWAQESRGHTLRTKGPRMLIHCMYIL